MMGWHRIRQATTKHDIAMSQVDLPAHIKAQMEREALKFGADPESDRFVYLRRDEDWYVSFGLDVNPPEYAVEKMRHRGWELMQ